MNYIRKVSTIISEIIFISFFIFSVFLNSCSTSKENMAKTTASSFLVALQKQDMSGMRIYYPDIDNIPLCDELRYRKAFPCRVC